MRSPRLHLPTAGAPETIVFTGCCNIWAPELQQLNGRWYLCYTADDGVDRNHRMYVLESAGSNPMGPYTFKAQLNTGNFHSIDGTVLRMPDGRLFFAWASGRSDGGGPGLGATQRCDRRGAGRPGPERQGLPAAIAIRRTMPSG